MKWPKYSTPELDKMSRDHYKYLIKIKCDSEEEDHLEQKEEPQEENTESENEEHSTHRQEEE